MNKLWTSLKSIGKITPVLLTSLLISCTDPLIYNQLRYGDMTGQIWDGYNPNKIRIRCGQGCRTLAFEKVLLPVNPVPQKQKARFNALMQQQKSIIRQFLRHQNRHQLVYVAPCDTWPIQTRENKQLARWVANEVSKAGFSVWITKPVIPRNPNTPPLCVSLLRGKLALIPPSCPNLRVKDSVYRMSSNFGCTANQNLATMISNPWDFLAPPGDQSAVISNRVIRGNMNYNKGEVAKILIERPYRTNANYN